MEVRVIPERRSWQQKFTGLGLGEEAAYWDDGRFAVVKRREIDTFKSSAEQLSARMKAALERCFTERRLKTPWNLDPEEDQAIRRSFGSRHQMAVQRIDFAQTRAGAYAVVGVEVDPVGGFLSCSLMQWLWIEERLSSGAIPGDCDQFNRLNETMLSCVRRTGRSGGVLHALFDLGDKASAAMAGYMVNLGIQSNTEVRPVDHRSVSTDGTTVLDPSGMPVEICWRTRIPGDSVLASSPLFDRVSFTTPLWYRLLPRMFESMGEITDHQDIDIRSYDGETAILSVWLVNAKAVAVSCTMSDNETPSIKRNIAHVVR